MVSSDCFINGFIDEIISSIRLFADHTGLDRVVDDPLKSAIKLNAGFSRIDIWASMWLVWCPASGVVHDCIDSCFCLFSYFVTFNPSKSVSLIFPEK